MAKDKMLQQASFERKKEKWDRKRETERGSGRVNDKTAKKLHQEEQHRRQKEFKEGRTRRVADRKIWQFQLVAGAVVIAVYAAALAYTFQQRGEAAEGEAAPPPMAGAPMAALTGAAALGLAAICWIGAGQRERLAREEEQREAASHIKGQLERKLTEKEREQKAKARRQAQAKEVRKRLERRAEEEAQTLQQATELARLLRQRREERLRAEAAEAAARDADDGERDERGWTAAQRRSLREAVAKYPEGWSHARKRRWEMIAAEVEGHDARECEATLALLEEEARKRAASAKAERQREPSNHAGGACGLEDDLDWMGESTEGGSWAADDDDDDEDEDEAHEDHRQPRMALELEPEHKGTEISLVGIKAMQGCASVQAELLHLQLTCTDCRSSTQVYLSGADEDACDAKTWCEGCSGLVSVHLRPTLLHAGSSRLCYVDCVRCTVTDVLPSVLMSTCEACDAPNVHKQEFLRNRLVHGTCFECHSKYVFGAESIKIEQITPCDPGKSSRVCTRVSSDEPEDPMDEIAEELRYLRKKAKTDPRQQMIKLGSQLPNMGACKHFKKSFKWYRFACCGRAFPCPECHVESGCPAAALGAHASRMICGKCSMEQAYSPARACEKCGFSMAPKGSAHWDGGDGTRNLAVMSAKDAKKFKGGLRQANSKTKTSSNKNARVGAKAKAAREHTQKFGR